MKLPMMISKTRIVIGSFLLMSSKLFAGVGLLATRPMTERQLPLSLSAILCARQATAEDLFKNGVFDAQVQALRLTPKTSSRITQRQIVDRAKKLVSETNQSAYAYGLCGDGSAWAMAFAVSDPVTVENNQLKIPVAFERSCVPGTLKALFSPELRGRSLGLAISKNNLALLPDQKGYAAVSCVMTRDRNGGQREVALVPVAGASIDVADIGKKSFAKIDENLTAWINEKRRIENLPALVEQKDLHEAAKSLMGSKLISHDLATLSSTRKALNNRGIEPIGEDRVRGRDLNEIVGLVWISPAHRDLILNPSAELVGVGVQKDEAGIFAVILAGRKTAGAVAKSLNPK